MIFCIFLSLILVLGKVLGTITLSWLMCFSPIFISWGVIGLAIFELLVLLAFFADE